MFSFLSKAIYVSVKGVTIHDLTQTFRVSHFLISCIMLQLDIFLMPLKYPTYVSISHYLTFLELRSCSCPPNGHIEDVTWEYHERTGLAPLLVVLKVAAQVSTFCVHESMGSNLDACGSTIWVNF